MSKDTSRIAQYDELNAMSMSMLPAMSPFHNAQRVGYTGVASLSSPSLFLPFAESPKRPSVSLPLSQG
jgi:hypothetical protein